MNNLEDGMIFKTLSEVYDYMNFTHKRKHTELTSKKLNYYCNWHKSGRKIIIDNVFDKPIEYKISIYEYKYNVGDILNVNKGKIKILSQLKIKNSYSNRKAYNCYCLNCKQEFIQFEYELDDKTGCPVCDNKRVIIGYNDMWTTAPEIASLLADKNDGYKYTKNSNKRVNWICPKCHALIEDILIKDITNKGLSCPSCSDGVSYPFKFCFI